MSTHTTLTLINATLARWNASYLGKLFAKHSFDELEPDIVEVFGKDSDEYRHLASHFNRFQPEAS